MLVDIESIMKILVFILFSIQTIVSLELSKYIHSIRKETFDIPAFLLSLLEKSSSCQTALGMQSGSIPDSAISVSSSYDVNTVGPKASR
jgi:hypothetical protein